MGSPHDRAPRSALVVDQVGLAEALGWLVRADVVALATEANTTHAYRPSVCLVQVAAHGVDFDAYFAIDALAFERTRPHPLCDLVARIRPDSTVLLHGGEYAVAGLRRDFGIDLSARGARVVDTQQAAVLLGLAETGYRSLCRALLGVQLPAPLSVDWHQRPLAQTHVADALHDVFHLAAIWRDLEARVVGADLLDELAVATRQVLATPPQVNQPSASGARGVAGRSTLDARGKRLLAALVRWRDDKGKELDTPPGRLMSNAQLIELAKAPDQAVDTIAGIRFHSRLLHADRESLRRAAALALADPDGAVPRPERITPTQESARALKARGPASALVKARSARLKTWRREEAARRGVGLQAILPAAALEHLAWFGLASLDGLAAVPQLGARRAERYGQVLWELARGATSV